MVTSSHTARPLPSCFSRKSFALLRLEKIWKYVTWTYMGGQSQTRPRCSVWKKESPYRGSVPLSLRASPRVRIQPLAGARSPVDWHKEKQTGPHASAIAALSCWKGKSNISTGAARNPFLSFLARKSSTFNARYLLLFRVELFSEKGPHFASPAVSACCIWRSWTFLATIKAQAEQSCWNRMMGAPLLKIQKFM